jgi:hypothetical protein
VELGVGDEAGERETGEPGGRRRSRNLTSGSRAEGSLGVELGLGMGIEAQDRIQASFLAQDRPMFFP